MSFKPDDIDSELSIEDLLREILDQLKLLNVRYEEACNTGIHEEDIK
jgi:hypothetical protein